MSDLVIDFSDQKCEGFILWYDANSPGVAIDANIATISGGCLSFYKREIVTEKVEIVKEHYDHWDKWGEYPKYFGTGKYKDEKKAKDRLVCVVSMFFRFEPILVEE